MATKSFLKNVSLRDPKQCKQFIRALEQSETSAKQLASKKATINIREMDSETIRKVFGGSNGKADRVLGD